MKDFFNNEILAQQFDKLQEWLFIELPIIIGLIIGFFIILRIAKFTINRLKKTLLKHASKSEKVDSLEAEKRINTLMGIVLGVVKIISQAYFSRNFLKMASLLAPVLRFYQFLLFPVAKPSAFLLDACLGKESLEFF